MGTSSPSADHRAKLDSAPAIAAASAERERIGRFNLAVLGKTGVGKSSLLNAAFGETKAATGIGLPVTKGITYYTNDDGSLGVWDFEGFETGTARTPAESAADDLRTIANGPADQRISAAWYCVTPGVPRIEPAEIAVLRTLHEQRIPVIVVLTKVPRVRGMPLGRWTPSDDAQLLHDWLAAPTEDSTVVDLPIDAVVMTAAVDQGRFGGPAHGVGELIESTIELCPTADRDAIKVAQRLLLGPKRSLARKAVAGAAAASAAVALQPIPVADAVLLAPIQLTMLGKIAVYYQLDLKVMLSGQVVLQFVMEATAKALLRQVVRLVPGAGNLVNATIAAAITAATGTAWTRLCEKVHLGEIPLDKVDEVWRDFAPTVTQVLAALAKRSAATTP
jgi:uncharacterized protein (DUF697 family)/GTP-binding protein EngB required for normal cell division